MTGDARVVEDDVVVEIAPYSESRLEGHVGHFEVRIQIETDEIERSRRGHIGFRPEIEGSSLGRAQGENS